MAVKSLLSFLTLIVMPVDGANIIMASAQFRSHVLIQLTLGEELVTKGHDVYIAIGSRFPHLESIEKRGIKVLTYRIPDDALYFASYEFEQMILKQIFNGSGDKVTDRPVISSIVTRDCTYMMQDKSFMNRAKQLEFDLAVVEPFLLGSCNILLPHHLRIPFISSANTHIPWNIRSPALPSFYPRHSFTFDDQEQISFVTRLVHFMVYVHLEINYPLQVNKNSTYTNLLEIYAPGISSWKELIRESELFLLEVDHHLGAPLPTFPNHISMAGITCKPARILPMELEYFVQQNKDGVILFSFGSMASYFPRDTIITFLKVFSRLNETVLAKCVIPDDIEVPTNVKIFSWLPQNDILGHPKTKLFITHCGNSGQHEALYHGVPMIGFPLFAEQHQNCHRGYMKGFGLKMNILSFTAGELFHNIQEVLGNPKYRKTIKRASEIFRNQPMTPKQRAVFWIEHVIKYGGKHLRSTAMELPLYQFLMLDIIVFLLAITFAVGCCVKFLAVKTIQKLFHMNEKKLQPKIKSN